jgi:hypothetical protein
VIPWIFCLIFDKALLSMEQSIGGLFWLVKKYFASSAIQTLIEGLEGERGVKA